MPTRKRLRSRENDLIDLRRAMLVEEGRRHDMTWRQAYSYTAELLKGTLAAASVNHIAATYKRIARERRLEPQRFELTSSDHRWYRDNFPRTQRRIRMDVSIAIPHYAAADGKGVALKYRTLEFLPRRAADAKPLNILAGLIGTTTARLRANLKAIQRVQRVGNGRRGDPVRFWLNDA